MDDKVNHPKHYTSGKIECIDIISEVTRHYRGEAAYCVGNIVKYLYRAKEKNGVEDIEKAQWYMNRLVNWIHGNIDNNGGNKQ